MLLIVAKFLVTPLVQTKQSVRYYVHPNAASHVVIHELSAEIAPTHSLLFSLYARCRLIGHRLKTGEYLFQEGATAKTILDQVTRGKGFYYYSFKLVPGWNVHQMRLALSGRGELQHLTAKDSDEEMMRRIGHAGVPAEGQFYPDTYFYLRDSTDSYLLQRAYQAMQTQLNNVWQQRTADTVFHTPYEALIAASLIEKEAKLDRERPIIAGVLKNRLQKKMLLQIDPTVVYGLGSRFNGKIHKLDLLENTAYNTYVHPGLPPTPIAMPGLSSLRAAVQPEVHDYLYFVAQGDGGHHFSKTLNEHHQAVSVIKQTTNIKDSQ